MSQNMRVEMWLMASTVGRMPVLDAVEAAFPQKRKAAAIHALSSGDKAVTSQY